MLLAVLLVHVRVLVHARLELGVARGLMLSQKLAGLVGLHDLDLLVTEGSDPVAVAIGRWQSILELASLERMPRLVFLFLVEIVALTLRRADVTVLLSAGSAILETHPVLLPLTITPASDLALNDSLLLGNLRLEFPLLRLHLL